MENVHGSKKAWKKDEDAILMRCVRRANSRGKFKWKDISASMAELNVVSSSKRCRERWTNHLHEGINHNDFSPSELDRLKELFDIHGRKWSTIAKNMNGRTANSVKNKVICMMRRGWDDVVIPLSSSKIDVFKAFEELSTEPEKGVGKITFHIRKPQVPEKRKCIGIFDERARFSRFV
jgi:hypothetical protein